MSDKRGKTPGPLAAFAAAFGDRGGVTGSGPSRLSFKTGYALRHPRRALRNARHRGRVLLRRRSFDHISCYRAAMRSGAARNPERAVGSRNREEWLRHGRLQFDYLLGHGLRPCDRMLEIGCGNLRAGRLFIDYLDAGNYYGLDISPDILLAAQRALAEFGLQAKLPHLVLVSDLTFVSCLRRSSPWCTRTACSRTPLST